MCTYRPLISPSTWPGEHAPARRSPTPAQGDRAFRPSRDLACGILAAAGGTPFKASDETRGVVADAALALVEAQLLAQVADDASLDGRATGLIGFNGALLAAAIAAKELLKLGPFWPSPIAVVIVTTLMLLWALYGGRRRLDRRSGNEAPQPQPNRVGVSVGIRADKFYEQYAEGPPLEARERLLDDLATSFEKNSRRITRKRRWLQAATLFLIAGQAVAALLIDLDRPTNMERTWLKKSSSHQNSYARCRDLQGSNKSGPAAKYLADRGRRDHRESSAKSRTRYSSCSLSAPSRPNRPMF
jgi:hypothetical protein